MHELFTQVLTNKDLSKAGDLFNVSDEEIVNDLTEVVNAICEITSLPDYVNNDNDQSVVEICITRVTSTIRETDSMEIHAEAMVALLESCLNHNLKPSTKDEDPPHAKISSDIISCIFLNYNKKEVMKRVLPVAVKFLHKGNKEISRNMASYLSLAAIHNATLLPKHIQLIIDSVISGIGRVEVSNNIPCPLLKEIDLFVKLYLKFNTLARILILYSAHQSLSGNYSLCRVLPQIYEVTKEPIHDHAMALVSLLPLCDLTEKLALLQLFSFIASNVPTLLEASLPQLCEYLVTPSTAAATMQVFFNLAEKRPQLLADSIPKIKRSAECHPNTVCSAAQVIAAVGRLNKEKAQDALNFILKYLPKVDRSNQGMLLREATQLCSNYPILCTDKMLAEVWQCSRNRSNSEIDKIDRNSSTINQSNGVTIVKVVDSQSENANCVHNKINNNGVSIRPLSLIHPAMVPPTSGYDGQWLNRQEPNRIVITPRLKLMGDSRSTGRLHVSAAHRSMTKLNNVNGSKIGSIGGLHKSMTKLSSNQISSQQGFQTPVTQSSTQQLINSRTVMSNGSRQYSVNTPSNRIYCGGVVTVGMQTSSPTKAIFGSVSALREEHINVSSTAIRHSVPKYCSIQSSHDSTQYITSTDVNHLGASSSMVSNRPNTPLPLSGSGSSPLTQSLILNQSNMGNLQSLSESFDNDCIQVAVPRRSNNPNITIVNNKSTNTTISQRISAFEPYPMRDTIQHFCEKHLDKIKAYMEKVSLQIPQPAKCTIEERRAKKMVKLHFTCQGQGEHCLYNRTFFTMKTRYPRIWIHLMFLTLQARSQSALSSRHTAVTSLKNCWDILKCENRTFLTLVTSAFPCIKDQDLILNELRRSGFCDVFERGNSSMNLWCCFLCNHPERAVGFLQDSQPVIEGQLKEKKGRWKFFKRWRTRYFTLSGAHLSYKESKDDKEGTPIEVHQIRSVKVSRGARNIPKAFEIFTGDQSLILKPKRGKDAEEWVQCLSIVVAHSHAKEMPSRSSSLLRAMV